MLSHPRTAPDPEPHPSGPLLKSRYRLHYRPESASLLAAILATGAILLLSWAILVAYEWIYSPSTLHLDPESTTLWGLHEINACYLYIAGLYDSRGQRLAHQFALVATGLLILFGRPLQNLLPLLARPKGRAFAYGVIALGCAAVLLACFGKPSLPLWCYALGLLLFLVLCLIGRRALRGLPNRAFMVASLVLVAGATLPGAFVTFDLAKTHHPVVKALHHFEVVLGDADRLAAGHRLFEDAMPRYGTLLPFLMAVFNRYIHPLDMGNCIHILQVLQALYVVLALYLFHKYCGGKWVFCLFALLMVVPWYHFHDHGLLRPNIGAWRTLSFPIGLFTVYHLRNQGFGLTAYLLGCVSGMALLLNLEAGVAASAGLIAYLCFRYPVPEQHSRAAWALGIAGMFAGGIATSVLCFVATCRILFGYWPNLLLLPQALKWASFFAATGFGGLKFEYQLLPIVMFGHATVVLIHTAMRRRAGIDFMKSFRACVAAMLVVWFGYYATRPTMPPSFYFLYAFLFLDLLRSAMVNFRWGVVNLSGVLAAGIIALVVLPECCEFNAQQYTVMRTRPNIVLHKPAAAGAALPTLDASTVGLLGSPLGSGPLLAASALFPGRPAGEILVSGVYLPGDMAAQVIQKAEFIRRTARDQPTIYFSYYAYLISKESGVVSPLPAGDLWVETRTKSAYQKLLSDIAQSQVSIVCLDLPGADFWGHSPFRDFFVQLRMDLSAHYQKERDTDGWEVWRRRE